MEQAHLEGLHCIHLIDTLPGLSERSDEWYVRARKDNHDVCGWYAPRGRDRLPSIVLNFGDIYRAIPRLWWWTTVPTLLMTCTLAHEIAHHLVANRGYIFKSGERFKYKEHEEAAANRYAFEVINRMQRQPGYKFGRWLMNNLADHYYMNGILGWRKRNYREAADNWYKAWSLNPDHDEAAYWYWRAKQLSSSGEGATALG